MNKTIVLTDYGLSTAGTAIANNADVTDTATAAKYLEVGNGIFIGMDSLVVGAAEDKQIGFYHRNQLGVFEPIVIMNKPITSTKITPVASQKKIGLYLLGGNVNALATGQVISISIMDTSKDPYDATRFTHFEYILNTGDNLTTPSDAAYYIRRLVVAFNAKYGNKYTMDYNAAHKFSLTTVDTSDFQVSGGGIYPVVVETVSQAFRKSIGYPADIRLLEKEYSTERGNTNYTTKQNTLLYTVPSNVNDAKTYVQYVLSYKNLNNEHPLGEGASAVTGQLIICVPSDGEIAAMDAHIVYVTTQS